MGNVSRRREARSSERLANERRGIQGNVISLHGGVVQIGEADAALCIPVGLAQSRLAQQRGGQGPWAPI